MNNSSVIKSSGQSWNSTNVPCEENVSFTYWTAGGLDIVHLRGTNVSFLLQTGLSQTESRVHRPINSSCLEHTSSFIVSCKVDGLLISISLLSYPSGDVIHWKMEAYQLWMRSVVIRRSCGTLCNPCLSPSVNPSLWFDSEVLCREHCDAVKYKYWGTTQEMGMPV